MVTETKVKPFGLMSGAQTDFYLSTAFSPALIAGRGYGKTIGFAAKAFNCAQQRPGARGVLTEPSFDMIRRNFMPVWEQLFGQSRVWQYRLVQQGVPSEIVFNNGFIYDLRPATNETAEKFRGATYPVAGMDELRNEDQLACYLALFGAVRSPMGESNYPLQFFITSTPEARRPWIRKIWTEHVDPISGHPLPPEDYPKFKARMEDNTYKSEAEKKRMRAMYGGDSRWARQELDAEDVSLEGVAFEEFTTANIASPPTGTVFKRTLAGLDFGGTSPTALYEIREDEHGNVWVTHEFYKRDASSYDWLRAAAEWAITRIICDPSGSDKELADLRRTYGVRIERARPLAKSFQGRLDLLRNRLVLRADNNRPRFFISPSCPNAINEIQNLAYAQARIGEYCVDRWETGSLDHAYDAICYGLSQIDLPSYEYRPTSVSWFGRTFSPAGRAI